MMEARTKNQRAATPFLKAWNQAKNLDEAEARFEAGLGIPHEEVMREMDEEEQAANVK